MCIYILPTIPTQFWFYRTYYWILPPFTAYHSCVQEHFLVLLKTYSVHTTVNRFTFSLPLLPLVLLSDGFFAAHVEQPAGTAGRRRYRCCGFRPTYPTTAPTVARYCTACPRLFNAFAVPPASAHTRPYGQFCCGYCFVPV